MQLDQRHTSFEDTSNVRRTQVDRQEATSQAALRTSSSTPSDFKSSAFVRSNDALAKRLG